MRTPEDAEIVKEMMSDGLSDEDIMHALGYVDGAPSGSVLPNGHPTSNKLTTDQQMKEEQAAEGQPGVDGGEDGGGDGQGGSDVLSHLAGLLNHVTKNKGAKLPKNGPNR